MLQTYAVPARTLDLLKLLASQPCLREFYLVGGTSLALQIGHRLSYDLDFFAATNSNLDNIENELLLLPGMIMKSRSNYALFLELENIKIDVLNYPYPFISPPIIMENIKLASKEDIVAMKLKTIMNRGAKRDFYDIYFLLEEFTVEQMLALFERKYQNIEVLAIYKSLGYFEDAEEQENPVLLKNKSLTWQQVKQRIIKETAKLL